MSAAARTSELVPHAAARPAVHDNNFDLIRLFAATQVLAIHVVEHMGGDAHNFLRDLIDRFPGVPIFFAISGYLVSQSLERSKSVSDYFFRRALRIYPALYVCLSLSVLSVLAVGYLEPIQLISRQFLVWLLGQLTFLQMMRTPLLYDYGTGNLNGSLWTIPVELQFYFVLPLLYFGLSRMRNATAVLIAAIVVMIGVNIYRYSPGIALSDSRYAVVVRGNVLPYLYIFLLGMLWQRQFARLKSLVEGKFWIWLPAYLATSYATSALGFQGMADGLVFVDVLMLSGLVMSAAFTARNMACRVLRGNDISYGMYIYHMPIVNLLLFLGAFSLATNAAIVFGATILLSTLSWFLVEKPALSLKNRVRFASRGDF